MAVDEVPPAVRRTRDLRRVGRIATAGVAAIAALRRARRLASVAPELRTPEIVFPFSVRGPATLAIARRALPYAPNARVESPVPPRAELIVADDGRRVRVLVFERADRPRPSGAVVWVHGGGLVMGSPEQIEGWCGRLAADLGIVVVSVDYRLAPEHLFPAALEDGYAALEWVHGRSAELAIDPDRVAVGGDSAGGGLAAALAQMAHDRGGPPLCFQLLQYPMLDDRTALRSDVDGLVWTARSNRWAWGAYLGHPVTEREDRPYASAARRADLTGLPPAWIGIGGIDLFRDEAVAYADRLRAAGVPCELHVEPGMYHGAETLRPGAPSMRRFTDRLIAALGDGLAVDS